MNNDTTQETNDVTALLKATQKIESTLNQIADHKMLLAYSSVPRLLWFQLLKGIAFGLGSVLGATVVLSFLVYLLAQIEFIPVIGDIVTEILLVVKQQGN